mmetsp:Transcript_25448/g.85116  ORF Transcript_25448/g.85116 Transcript_25448/m.85116 type:complete len:410 (+) Transcript_25448:90-1319(+)
MGGSTPLAAGGSRLLMSRVSTEGSCSQAMVAALNELREQSAALLDCLRAAGLVSMDRFEAELHRRRFATMKLAHPCSWNVMLAEVLLVPSDVFLRVSAFAGLAAVRTLRRASAGIAQAAAQVEGDVQDVCIKLCMVGGYNGQQSLNTAETFDSAQGCWKELPPMLQPRFGAAAAALDGSLYVCGGHDGQVVLRSAEKFDPALNRWTPLPASGQRRSRAVAAILARQLYVLSGHDGQNSLSSAERLCPASGRWELLPPMAQRRRSAGAAAVGGAIYLCGGLDGEDPLRSVERYIPDHGWQELPPMIQPRYGAMAAAIAGCIYVCGESTSGPSAERFDPATRVWEVLPTMLRQRTTPAVAAAAGRLYVCGGYSEQQPLRDIERFDPRTGTWEVLPHMLQPRALAVAVAICV